MKEVLTLESYDDYFKFLLAYLQDLSPPSGSNSDEVSELDPFEKFSYKHQEPQQNSNGWRTTKSKVEFKIVTSLNF